MSTVPDDAWRDAGLEDADDTTSLLEESEEPDAAAPADEQPEEYRPRTARPDLDGAASEADVVEQSQVVRGLDEPDAEGGADDVTSA
ncbi:hypothetical protein GCM10009809_05540 [Isoptericola hypogeus]|uniref:DUF5709 domain-containing protein n=1 Tax=Isoptericola hypogeus TaxID=300179 RepID=A0ABP4UXM0_9MICO